MMAAVAQLACVPPDKSLESDLRELLELHALEHQIVFCQTGDESRTAMCVFDRSPDGPTDFIEAFQLHALVPDDAEGAELLEMWSDPVKCERVGVFALRFQRGVYRSPADAELYRLPHTAFRHIVLFDSALRDQVCLQFRYAEGMEPGWR